MNVLIKLLCGPELSGSQNEDRRMLTSACIPWDPFWWVLTDAVSKAPYIPIANLGTEALQLFLKISSIKKKKKEEEECERYNCQIELCGGDRLT